MDFLRRGLAPFSEGLPLESVAVLVGALLVSWLMVSFVWGAAAYFLNMRLTTWPLVAKDDLVREIRIHTQMLTGALEGVKSGTPLIVTNKRRRSFRLILRRKVGNSPQTVEVPRYVYDVFLAPQTEETEQTDGQPAQLEIRRMSTYTPANLWNHPDQPTQIGVRLTVVFTIVTVLIQALMESLPGAGS